MSTSQLQQGTAITWSTTGDYTLTLTSLSNGSARQGAKGDLGSTWSNCYHILFTSSVGSAATNGNQIELYWAHSTSATAGTDNPGGLSGTDASFGTPGEYKYQLTYVGSINLSNNAGTAVQKQVMFLYPKARYGMPVVVNSSGQSLGSTAGDHNIVLTPVSDVIA